MNHSEKIESYINKNFKQGSWDFLRIGYRSEKNVNNNEVAFHVKDEENKRGYGKNL
jgi:hypothetical protein